MLAPLSQDPARGAILLDIDGTLAPIVERAENAHVREESSKLLGRLARRYRLVACISGRSAAEARRLVGVGSIAYAGSHGAELLDAGATKPQDRPRLRELGGPRAPLRRRAGHARAAGAARAPGGQGADRGLPLARHARRGRLPHPARGPGRRGRVGRLRHALGAQGARGAPAGPRGQGPGRADALREVPARRPRCTPATTPPTSTPSPPCARCATTGSWTPPSAWASARTRDRRRSSSSPT